MKVREQSEWAKRPMWQKRLHGFGCYLVCVVMVLFWPVEVDKALYKTLRDQFEDGA